MIAAFFFFLGVANLLGLPRVPGAAQGTLRGNVALKEYLCFILISHANQQTAQDAGTARKGLCPSLIQFHAINGTPNIP